MDLKNLEKDKCYRLIIKLDENYIERGYLKLKKIDIINNLYYLYFYNWIYHTPGMFSVDTDSYIILNKNELDENLTLIMKKEYYREIRRYKEYERS